MDAGEFGVIKAYDCEGRPIDMSNWKMDTLYPGTNQTATPDSLLITGNGGGFGFLTLTAPFGVKYCTINMKTSASPANVGVPVAIEKNQYQ